MAALVHLVLLVWLFAPPNYGGIVVPVEQGAGGPGKAGGGGGRSGLGPRREVIQYVRVLSAPPLPVPTPTTLQFRPPLVEPVQPQIEPLSPAEPLAAPGSVATGDASAGSGTGSGGGVGSGVGTGTGSGTGPGTGGGTQENFPPTPTEMFIPPLPVPASVRGSKIVAQFDVDEKGRVLSMTFTDTGDRGYNRRLNDVLRSFRFRPGTRPDGTPVRMMAQITIDLP